MCMHVCVLCHKDGRALVGICDSRAIGERAELLAGAVLDPVDLDGGQRCRARRLAFAIDRLKTAGAK